MARRLDFAKVARQHKANTAWQSRHHGTQGDKRTKANAAHAKFVHDTSAYKGK